MDASRPGYGYTLVPNTDTGTWTAGKGRTKGNPGWAGAETGEVCHSMRRRQVQLAWESGLPWAAIIRFRN